MATVLPGVVLAGLGLVLLLVKGCPPLLTGSERSLCRQSTQAHLLQVDLLPYQVLNMPRLLNTSSHLTGPTQNRQLLYKEPSSHQVLQSTQRK